MFRIALDCSTARGSLSFVGGVGWTTDFPAGRGQGGRMFHELEWIMREIRLSGQPLTEIVVGLGPGSYSGVRQSIALAVGLAAATGAELWGVPSPVALESMYRRAQVVSDARRGTFYYTARENRVCVAGPELLPDAAALEARLAERPDWPVFVIETPLPGGLLPDAGIATPDASDLLHAPAASRRRAPLEPIYLRPVSITLPKAAPPLSP